MVKIKGKLTPNKIGVLANTSLKRKLLKGRNSLALKSPNKALLLKRKVLKSPKRRAKWHTLMKDKAFCSVKALLTLNAKKNSVNDILLDEHQPVYMVVQCIRIPEMQTKNFRFLLPHPVIDEESDVCLFVPDLKKGRNVDHEPTVEHYKELLKANQVTGISEIIPMRQLKVEYAQFELRRQLMSRFDLFLSDGRISGHIHHILGKELYRRRMLPVPVDMKAKNLKLEFDRAKSKVLMLMKGTGDKAALKIGHTKQKVEDIVENILEVANQLGRQYPGGWNNVKSLYIHVQDSKPIPVYISLKPRNNVEVPKVEYITPKKAVAVEGELSTFPGTKVIVLPDGEVIVKKALKSEEDAEMGSDWDEYDSDMEIELNDEENMKVEIKKEENEPQVKQEQSPNDENNSESEEEVEEEEDEVEEKVVEDAENAYLNEWHKERVSKMKSKTKEGNKKDGSKKPNEKKTLKRKVVNKVIQEIPKKKIKVSKKSQTSNKKILAKQKNKGVTEESEDSKAKIELKKQNIKTSLVTPSKKTVNKPSLKKKINTDLKKCKTKQIHLKPKKLSSITEMDTPQYLSANQKMLKSSKKIAGLDRQGLKSKQSTLKKPLPNSRKATKVSKPALKLKSSAL